METKEKINNNGAVKNNTPVKGANPVTAENKNPQFVAGNPVNKDSEKPKDEKPQAEAPQTEQPKTEVKAEPQQEAPKAEVKAEPAKPVRNLEETIKFLEEMHERKIKRDKYLATLKNLDEFEIDLKKDNDDIDNYYTGCILTIQDDANRKFTTKNPVIIWTIAQQVTSICEGKLAEVEAGLVITA